MSLGLEAACTPVELFVLAQDPLDFFEFAGDILHGSPLEQEGRRTEPVSRHAGDKAGVVAELVRAATGASVRNQGFARPTKHPISGARGGVSGIEVNFRPLYRYLFPLHFVPFSLVFFFLCCLGLELRSEAGQRFTCLARFASAGCPVS